MTPATNPCRYCGEHVPALTRRMKQYHGECRQAVKTARRAGRELPVPFVRPLTRDVAKHGRRRDPAITAKAVAGKRRAYERFEDISPAEIQRRMQIIAARQRYARAMASA